MRGAADDLYAILGIEAGATDEELRRAWKQLVHRWHPDRAGADATFIFQKLSAAYEVLADPTTRAAYDRSRQPPRKQAPGVLLHRLSANLNALLACGIARRVSDELIELFLDDEEATGGGMATIPMRVPVPCPGCRVTTVGCAHCNDTRTVDELFAAWLAIPPGVSDGALLRPSALLPGMKPIAFRVRLA